MMGPFHLQGEYSRFDLDLANAAKKVGNEAIRTAAQWKYAPACCWLPSESKWYLVR